MYQYSVVKYAKIPTSLESHCMVGGMLRILKVPGSNFNSETDYPH
jgi:hypothetical protein